MLTVRGEKSGEGCVSFGKASCGELEACIERGKNEWRGSWISTALVVDAVSNFREVSCLGYLDFAPLGSITQHEV